MALALAGLAGGAYFGASGALTPISEETYAATDALAPAKIKKKTTKSKSSKATKTAKSQGSAFDGVEPITKTDWVDVTAKRDALSKQILEAIGGASATDAQKFMQSEKNMLLAAQWIVAQAEIEAEEENTKRAADRVKNLENLTKQLESLKSSVPQGTEPSERTAWELKQLEKKVARAQAEAKAAYTMTEALADSRAITLMEKIASNADWMEQFAFSGECVRPGMALAIMVKIAEQQPEFFTSRMVRDIATATALEYAKSGWNQDDAVERAAYYIRSYKAGRLNTVFDTVPFWQRRTICGCKGDNDYGSIASLEWSLENVHIPAHEYPGSCWRCSYRLNNIYGDSIHGPQYYAPWDGGEFAGNRTALTYLVGGVCGSLSHFGAFSALANGIPALTAGEPGHCAYIVLINDKWTPAYSLTWDRGLHWQVFRNVYSFSSLHSATEMYDKKAEKTTALSQAWRVAGNVFALKGDKDKAENCFENAVKTQPRNFMAWREWCLLLQNGGSAKSWVNLNTSLCNNLVPLYPEMAYEVMQKWGLAGMEKAMGKDKAKMRKCFLDFWRKCDTYGPDRWHIERLADAQLKTLGITDKTPAEVISIYSDILSACSGSANYMSVILGWGNKLSEKMSDDDKKKFMAGMIKGMQKGKGMSDEDKNKLLAPAILAAEKTGDINTFQSLGAMLPAKYKKPDNVLPKHEPFPGKLASKGGIVLASSTSQWDNPCSHWGLLEECGGTFHTGKDTDAWLVVQMPRQVNVTGVVLVTNPGNLHRLHNMKIQVSENGKDWVDVHQFDKCTQRVMRADLTDKLPVAKYVRIVRPGGPEFFHLNAVYVYGNQAA